MRLETNTGATRKSEAESTRIRPVGGHRICIRANFLGPGHPERRARGSAPPLPPQYRTLMVPAELSALPPGLYDAADRIRAGEAEMKTLIAVADPGRRELLETALGSRGHEVTSHVETESAWEDFKRQAIAAIDERTTDTCLRVHGQVVGMTDPFKLTGTPRYADEVPAPPFHDYCRTAVVLVRNEDVNDRTTNLMRDAARAEINARASAQSRIDDYKKRLADLGAAQDVRIRQDDTAQIKNLRNKLRQWRERLREPIHPASATSGRR